MASDDSICLPRQEFGAYLASPGIVHFAWHQMTPRGGTEKTHPPAFALAEASTTVLVPVLVQFPARAADGQFRHHAFLLDFQKHRVTASDLLHKTT